MLSLGSYSSVRCAPAPPTMLFVKSINEVDQSKPIISVILTNYGSKGKGKVKVNMGEIPPISQEPGESKPCIFPLSGLTLFLSIHSCIIRGSHLNACLSVVVLSSSRGLRGRFTQL